MKTREMEMLLFLPLIAAAFSVVIATSEESTNTLTCYTCNEALSNFLCNRYAVDRPCPNDYNFCQTLHVIEPDEKTASVTKVCANQLQCNMENVGCKEVDNEGRQMCISCCDERLCNEGVPTNKSTAAFFFTRSGGVSRSFGLDFRLTVFSVLFISGVRLGL